MGNYSAPLQYERWSGHAGISRAQHLLCRLVALRIQLSRFLSGRYYSVASNYKRLLFQQESLVRGYFKAKFNQGARPAAHSYLRQIQEL